jgi:tetratricopeptide (TPR) repeat protein
LKSGFIKENTTKETIKVMKALMLSVVAVLFVSLSFGQGGKYGASAEDSVECITQLSLYGEFIKQKNYKDALPGWRKACDICPKSSKKLYTNGVKIYRGYVIGAQKAMKKEADEAKKAKHAAKMNLYLDTLMGIYDARIENFGQEGFVVGRKANDLFRFLKDSSGAANEMFAKSMELQGDRTEAGVLSGYYQSLFEMVKQGKGDKVLMLEGYLPVNELIAKCIAKAKTAKNAEKLVPKYETARSNIDEMFIKVGECPDISEIFSKKLEADPTNLELQKKILKVLNKRGCTDGDLFKKVAVAVHEAEPGHESAFAIGKMELSEKKYSSSITYFKQAMELCGEDCPDKLTYTLAAAQASLKSGSDQSAYNFAAQAIKIKSNCGDAYLIQAQCIAGTQCGTNALELKYVYWVAYDVAAKAKAVDSSVSSKANKLMGSYKANWPERTELFNHGKLDAGEVTVKCWINRSTKVREKV